jgi:hypothetical protein
MLRKLAVALAIAVAAPAAGILYVASWASVFRPYRNDPIGIELAYGEHPPVNELLWAPDAFEPGGAVRR